MIALLIGGPGRGIQRNADLELLFKTVCESYGFTPDQVREKNRAAAFVEARRAFAIEARRRCYVVSAIGAVMARSSGSVRYLLEGV
jgi:hypothetical protein